MTSPSVSQRLQSLWDLDPDQQAVCSQNQWWSWGRLTAVADRLDEVWTKAGLGPEHRIALALEARPEFVAAVLAVLSTRRCIVMVNPLQPVDRLVDDLARVRPPVLVASPDAWSKLNRRDIDHHVGLQIALHEDGTVAASGIRRLAGESAGGAALEMLTSGTTGPPKRIRLSYGQIDSSLRSATGYSNVRAAASGHLPAGISVVSTPLVHIGGLWGVLQSLWDRRRTVLLERFRVDTWIDAVRRHRPRLAALPPAAVRMVYDADLPAEHLASLRAINSGAAPLEPDLADAFQQRYGVAVLSVYGATEFSGSVAGWTMSDHRKYWKEKRGSVGRAQPGVELRVVDDDGQSLPAGAVGRLEVKSAQTADGADQWTSTSDMARLDSDSFLWIEGRADDAIIRGGFKVQPTTVARVLEAHPAVREAAVVAKRDTRLGQVPVAAVELADGAEPPDASDLIELCRSELLPYEVPVAVVVTEALPRSPSMKVSRQDLLDMFADDGHQPVRMAE